MTKFWLVSVLYFSSVGWAMENRELYNLYKQGKYAETEQALQSAVERTPEDLERHYDLGVVQYRQGKFKEAKESFERAKETTDPNAKARALYNLGNAEVKLGNLEGAKKAYQESLSYDLENVQAQENLKWVEEQLKKQPPQQRQEDQPKQDQQEQDEAEQKNQDKSKDQERADDQRKSDQKEDQNKDGEEQKDQEKDPDQPNQDRGEKDKQDQPQRGEQSEGNQGGQQRQPTPEEVDRQDAERIIRSIDDQVVPYMYRPEGMPAEKEEESNGNDW